MGHKPIGDKSRTRVVVYVLVLSSRDGSSQKLGLTLQFLFSIFENAYFTSKYKAHSRVANGSEIIHFLLHVLRTYF